MRLRPGEIAKCRAVAVLRHHAQIHLQAVAQADGGARRPLLYHVRHVLIADEPLHDRSARFGCDHDIEVADGFAPSPVASRDLGLQHAVSLPKMTQQGDNDLFGGCQFGSRDRPGALGDRTQHLRFDARSNTRHGPQFAGLRRSRELVDRIDAEFLVQQVHALGAQARQRQQCRDPRRHLTLQLVEHRQMLATRDDGDLVSEIPPDPRQLIKVLAIGQHVGDVAWQLADQPRRLPVGAHPERVGPLDVEEIGNLVELAGNLGVDDGHGKLCALPSIGEAAPAAGLSP